MKTKIKRRKGGPGRNKLPVSERTTPICTYQRRADIAKLGGIVVVRGLFYDYFDLLLKKKK